MKYRASFIIVIFEICISANIQKVKNRWDSISKGATRGRGAKGTGSPLLIQVKVEKKDEKF